MEYDQSGGEVKRLHAGSAAHSGVEAAQLAQLGLTGPRTIFEGQRGIFRLFAAVLALDTGSTARTLTGLLAGEGHG